MQCSQRWRRSLNPSISRNNWTAEEEMDLIILVMQYGTQSWPQIAKKLGKRSDVQCRYHYILMSKQSRVQLIFKDNHQFESQFSNSEHFKRLKCIQIMIKLNFILSKNSPIKMF